MVERGEHSVSKDYRRDGGKVKPAGLTLIHARRYDTFRQDMSM